MGKIVAIGGGDLSSLETLEIDREIISLTGKSRPKALFIPTASGDSVERWHEFESVYRGRLGCDTDFLYLLGVTPTPSELKEKILSSDLIFVGGGNTLKMMRRWRRLGVDRVLRSAHDKGIVLCGVSAGAICWFTHGHSDSMSFYSSDSWSYIRVKGMGLIDAFACPHYDSETAGVRREQDFHNMVTKHGRNGDRHRQPLRDRVRRRRVQGDNLATGRRGVPRLQARRTHSQGSCGAEAGLFTHVGAVTQAKVVSGYGCRHSLRHRYLQRQGR